MANKTNKLLKQAEKYYAAGDLPLARQYCEKILSREPDNLEAMNNLGVILYQEGYLEEAVEHLQAVLNYDDKNEDALANLAMIAALLKERSVETNVSDRCLNVGFVSIWFERGQSYVTKMIRDAIAVKHKTFIFARTGGVFNQAMLETTGQWDVPNLTVWHRYDIPGPEIIRWIKENRLHAVILNEEYDWELVKAVKSTGIKVMTYLDYYKDDWKKNMGLYDAVLCSTRRTYNLVREMCRAHYMGWGVDTELFHPTEQKPEFTFFHNAGWLGINFRKMTPAAIAAFDAISKVMPEVNMLIHSQAQLDLLPPAIVDIVRNNRQIVFHEETLPAPGLYHKGKIMVFPTKLEGLGLPLFEALSCGLPVIATNAPPMSEFIRDGYNGALVDVAFRTTRDDNVAFPEEIVDMTDLAIKMAKMAHDENMLHTLSQNARIYAEEQLAFPLLTERILNIVEKVA